MNRRLPSAAEAAEILARKRTRPAREPARPAGKTLVPYLRALEPRFGAAGTRSKQLSERWIEIAGEVLGRHSEPVKLTRPRKGAPAVLEIRVDGSAAVLVQHQVSDILERVNLVLGAGAVDRLRITQGQVKPPPGPRPTRHHPPLDAAAEAELAQGLARAPDGPLKAALLRLGRVVARRG